MIHSKLSFTSLAFVSLFALAASACKSDKTGDAATASSAEPLGSGEHRHRELPPAAFDACQGKGVGEACSVKFGDKQIDAKCAAAPDGRLACRPERGQRKQPE